MKIYKSIQNNNKNKEIILIVFISLFLFDLTMFRLWATNETKFLFLNWNLILALIPWVISTTLLLENDLKNKRKSSIFLIILWLLFLPNSFYILTDFFHFRLISKMPEWFDLLLIFSFVWLGLLAGILSILDMEKISKSLISERFDKFFISTFMFIISFGIYLGRYSRWNSWDFFTRPISLFSDILNIFIHPLVNFEAWALTFFMGFVLNLIYWSFRLVRKK